MAFDVYMILLSAFAIFGVYCLLEMAVTVIEGVKSPKSVMIMKYSEDDYTYKKARFIVNSVFNNKMIFICDDDKENNIYSDTVKLSADEIEKAIFDALQ